jgi:chromosome partitioning protein
VNDAIVYKEALRSVFAINREIVNTAIGRDVSSALGETQVPVLSSHIAQRVAFAESLANGQTVFETKTDAKAVAEIRALGAEILALFELDRSEPFRRPA